MTELDKEALRNKIILELERLKLDVQSLAELTSPDTLDDLDEVSRMDAIVSKSVHAASLAAARQRAGKLEYALKRLDADPEFGYCAECGEKIPTARLMSMPEARCCVACAEEQTGRKTP
ncbi:MAG: TraR/DksA family transcriptional regulator [Deltaproteobacteria bacterium]|jgi:DnaK suppressor protein|nr:TraR/DksA family transcriptional regulator [Deltaproteobacteria bacterium]